MVAQKLERNEQPWRCLFGIPRIFVLGINLSLPIADIEGEVS
jgi:hypothetical protein